MSTPIRQQYLRIKAEHPDAILLFRLGDFYETFDEDAEVTARELGIALTSKPLGKDLRVPLAGIPVHSFTQHVARLVGRGYRVAVCEQLEDPALSKGLVDRGVVRVITPGTAVDPSMLDARDVVRLVAVLPRGDRAGIATADLSTGEFRVTQVAADALAPELERLSPRELLLPEDVSIPDLPPAVPVTTRDAARFDPGRGTRQLQDYFRVATLEAFGCASLPAAIGAAAGLLSYLQETQRAGLGRLTAVTTYDVSRVMALDAQTRRNLELTAGVRSGQRAGSLVSTLDACVTPGGSRLLAEWLDRPLLDRAAIEVRHDAVAWFLGHGLERREVRDTLGPTSDLARIAGRIRAGTATPRDLRALVRTVEGASRVAGLLAGADGLPPAPGIGAAMDAAAVVDRALVDDPKAKVGEGGVFRDGFSDELDGFGIAQKSATTYIAGLEQQERERTGIRSLKVGFNRVFGYYLEVPNTYRDGVPDDYIRKQTLVGAERYITPELKEYEAIVLNAQDRLAEIEASLFRRLLEQLDAGREHLEEVAAWLAGIDVLQGLAESAQRHRLVRPELVEEPVLEIRGGRHLVVEASLPPGSFVPNDCELGISHHIQLVTGPNMAGKSTYLRQVALIVLLAQAGSYVPAESARIGLTDRIFTRIGAQDDLAAGQSTFMVEMVETARILHHATSRSLVVLDEIGRGTSTWDGLAIARALVEYLHNHPGLRCRTLFATHFHELTSLEESLPGVGNTTVLVSDDGGQIVFRHQIVAGRADRSYGVHVAELAGLPRALTSRATELVRELEANPAERPGPPVLQLGFDQGQDEIISAVRQADVHNMTPLEAMTFLYDLQRQLRDQPG